MRVALTRRAMLGQSVSLAGAALLGINCAGRPAPSSPLQQNRRRFARVLVAPDRVVRSVAGLRPYRESGFVLRLAKYDDKPVVHNYGHGGGGISLSWGTAALAVELLEQTGHKRVAVLGCGVMGLSVARLLQDRGYDVTIYAKDLPPNTTSNIAGAQWSPFTVHDATKITPAYQQQFERAARLSHRYFQHFIGDHYGVRWIENYQLRDRLPSAPVPNPLNDLYPGSLELRPDEHPFAYRYVRRFTTMLIEPSIYLGAVMRDYLLRGGKVVIRDFKELRDVLALPEPVIVNCSGLGSRSLFGDQELTPLKGQLVFLLPQPEVDYILLRGDYYMFPRSDGILLGGSKEPDVWSADSTPEVVDRILQSHAAMFGQMRET